jgi:integrase
MGNVARRPDGKWRARYRDPAGKEHSRHFRRKLDAERWLAGVEIAKSRGEWIDPALSRVTVGAWAKQWLAAQAHLKPTTRNRYSRLLSAQVLPAWERVPLASVTHADVVAWVSQMLADGYAPATVRQAHRVLSLILSLAMRDGRLSRNPAEGVRLPQVRTPEKVFLTHAQVDALAEACAPYQLLVRLLAYTGLRFGGGGGASRTPGGLATPPYRDRRVGERGERRGRVRDAEDAPAAVGAAPPLSRRADGGTHRRQESR